MFLVKGCREGFALYLPSVIAVSSAALAAPGVKEVAEVMTWPFRLAAWVAAFLQGLLFLLMPGPGTGLAFRESLLLAAALRR